MIPRNEPGFYHAFCIRLIKVFVDVQGQFFLIDVPVCQKQEKNTWQYKYQTIFHIYGV